MGQNAVRTIQILGKAEQLGAVLIRPHSNCQISAVFAAIRFQRIAAVLLRANPIVIAGTKGSKCPLLAIQSIGSPLLDVGVICHFSVCNVHHQTGTGVFKGIDHAGIHRTTGICH